jgi:hypothetical protein
VAGLITRHVAEVRQGGSGELQDERGLQAAAQLDASNFTKEALSCICVRLRADVLAQLSGLDLQVLQRLG